MRSKPKVTVLIPCRDGEKTLRNTIISLLNQTADTYIAVADDASVDSTSTILKEFSATSKVLSVRYPRREPRNYARVPVLLNMILNVYPDSDFFMISGDDSVYPKNYISMITEFMNKEKVDIASGYFENYNPTSVPSGSGRVISSNFFKKITPFPPNIGWESWVLYKALSLGRKVAVYPIKFQHIRKYSIQSLWTFGHSAYLNGTPLIFTIGRSVKAFLFKEHTLLGALAIVSGHVEYILRHPTTLDTAQFVNELQKWRIKSKILTRIN